MPFIIAPIFTLLVADLGLSVEAAVGIISVVGTGLVTFGSSMVISAITRALSNKGQPPRQTTIQSPIAARRVIYGNAGRMGGVITFVDSWDDNTGNWIGMVLTYAAHQIQSFDAIWLNGDQLVFSDPIGQLWQTPNNAYVSGNAFTAGSTTTTKYNNLVWVQANFGSAGQPALTEPQMVDPSHWTTAHRQAGCAHIFVAINYQSSVFSSGLPTVLADIHGKNDIYDPRGVTTTLDIASITDTTTPTTSGHVARIVQLTSTWTGANQIIATPIPAFGPTAELVIAGVTGGSPGTPWNGTFTPYQSIDSGKFIISIPSGGGTSSGSGGTCVVENNNIGYSENAALCLRDYLTNPTAYGILAQASEIDDVQTIAAANICDEDVDLATGGEFSYAFNGKPAGNQVDPIRTFTQATTFPPNFGGSFGGGGSSTTCTLEKNGSSIGTAVFDSFGLVTFTTSGGASVSFNPGDTFSIKYPSSIPSDFANISFTFVAASGGFEPRYALNGVLDTAQKPGDNIASMLSACSGRLVYRGGTFGIYPGAYLTPTLSLDETDIRGPIEVITSVPKNQLYNGVKGTFIYPGASSTGEYWSSTDFPPVLNDTYVEEDSGEILWKDAQFDFTNSFATVQRLAKIDLERSRRQIQVTLPCKLTAYKAQVLDTIQLSITRYGWNNKTFEVLDAKLNLQADPSGKGVTLGVDLTLQETDSGVYAWDKEEEPEGSVLSPLDYPDALPAGGDFSYLLNAKPGNGEVDAIWTFTQATTFPGNFAGSFGILLSVPLVQNPWTCTLLKNGSAIGTVVSTAYAATLTFTTTSGAAITFNPGDTFSIEYPATADTGAAGVNLTFVASS